MEEKTITIRVPRDLHKAIKKEAADQEVSLKDYILSLIKQDLNLYENDSDDSWDDEINDEVDPLANLYINEEDPEERARLYQKDMEKAMDKYWN